MHDVIIAQHIIKIKRYCKLYKGKCGAKPHISALWALMSPSAPVGRAWGAGRPRGAAGRLRLPQTHVFRKAFISALCLCFLPHRAVHVQRHKPQKAVAAAAFAKTAVGLVQTLRAHRACLVKKAHYNYISCKMRAILHVYEFKLTHQKLSLQLFSA